MIMSDYDPNRLDPNRQDLRDVPFDSGNGFNWNWLLGGIAAVVLLLVAMSFMTSSDRTAEGIAPSGATTGQSSPPPIVAPAEKMSPRPSSPNQ
jgi:hypothetical protein